MALAVADLPPGATRVVRVDGLELLVCNVEGEIYACENRCPHQDFALSDARLRGCFIECSLHGGRFDVRDGRPGRAPTRASLAIHRVYSTPDGGFEIEL